MTDARERAIEAVARIFYEGATGLPWEAEDSHGQDAGRRHAREAIAAYERELGDAVHLTTEEREALVELTYRGATLAKKLGFMHSIVAARAKLDPAVRSKGVANAKPVSSDVLRERGSE